MGQDFSSLFFFLLPWAHALNMIVHFEKVDKQIIMWVSTRCPGGISTAMLWSFSWAGLSALWPVGSTVPWLQDLSVDHQPSGHSCPQQRQTGFRGNGVTGNTLLPYDLTKRTVKGFLKSDCFLRGGEGLYLGVKGGSKGKIGTGSVWYEENTHQTSFCFPKMAPLNLLGIISVWINWYL